MDQKVILDPSDFQKIIAYITQQPVPFNRIEAAMEVKAILSKAPIMEVINRPDEEKRDIKAPAKTK